MVATTVVLDGRYRLDVTLGEGGFARVYLATHLALDRRVAVKLLHPALVLGGGQHDFLDRFRREARAVAALDHPNILGIHDYGEADGVPYLAMPYVAGGTLADLLAREGRLAPERAACYVAQVAAALDHAHARGIVHRDIKPQNMLLRADDGRLLLADFGIAKVVGAGNTLSGTAVIGTLPYMPPEQFRGLVSPATDLYALGCVAFQLLAGQPPYRGTTAQIMWDHAFALPPRLDAHLPAPLAAALQPVLDRALAKDPAARFPAAGAFADALARALAATTAPAAAASDATTVVAPVPPPPPALRTPVAAPRRVAPAPPAPQPAPAPAGRGLLARLGAYLTWAASDPDPGDDPARSRPIRQAGRPGAGDLAGPDLFQILYRRAF